MPRGVNFRDDRDEQNSSQALNGVLGEVFNTIFNFFFNIKTSTDIMLYEAIICCHFMPTNMTLENTYMIVVLLSIMNQTEYLLVHN